jgi:hypothetical protein
MVVESLSLGELDRLVGRLADVHHDLGKYVCFEVRFVEDGASAAVLREALRADLLRTRCRTQADGEVVTETAWSLWARLRPSGLDDDPDVEEVDGLIAQLESADLGGDLDHIQQTSTRARAVSAATRRLLNRGRAALADLSGDTHG